MDIKLNPKGEFAHPNIELTVVVVDSVADFCVLLMDSHPHARCCCSQRQCFSGLFDVAWNLHVSTLRRTKRKRATEQDESNTNTLGNSKPPKKKARQAQPTRGKARGILYKIVSNCLLREAFRRKKTK